MMRKLIFNAILLLIISNMVLADYITPEDNVEISPNTGIYARESAAKKIKNLNITEDVIKLYNSIQNLDGTVTMVKSKNNCITLYVDTENNKKNFIEQVTTHKGCLK
jgi:hypothetical protein